MDSPARKPSPDRAVAWTLPLLCAGIALIACCLLIPAADENHRLVYERQKLQMDLEQIQKQVEVYDEFLQGVSQDPTLAERLAQRQMKYVRKGTSVLALRGQNDERDISPYLLVNLPPPVELPAYEPMGGHFAALCRQPRSQLFLIGGGLLLVAVGLVIGADSSVRS